MRAESGESFGAARFHVFGHRDEHGDEFVGLLAKRNDQLRFHHVCIGQNLQPKVTLVEFLLSTLKFTDEIQIRLGPASLSIMRRDGGAGPQQLSAEHLPNSVAPR